MNQIKLPQELIAAIDSHLRNLHDMLKELDKAEQCGIECQQWRKERDEEVRLLQLLRENYG